MWITHGKIAICRIAWHSVIPELVWVQIQHGVSWKDDYVLELDSSTNVKFSRHIVVRLPQHAFLNNRHVGAFIHNMLSSTEEGTCSTVGSSFLVKAVKPLVYWRAASAEVVCSEMQGACKRQHGRGSPCTEK